MLVETADAGAEAVAKALRRAVCQRVVRGLRGREIRPGHGVLLEEQKEERRHGRQNETEARAWPELERGKEKRGSKGQPGKLGIAVRPLTDEERKQLEAEGGLMVEQAEGAAARAGVQAGDVILALNNQPVKSVDQLRRLVDKSRGSVALLIQREGNKIYVPVRIS